MFCHSNTSTPGSWLWALPFFLLLGWSAQAQSSSVREQLTAIEGLMDASGYFKTHDFEIDYLREDETDRYTATLREGFTYKIMAVCDNDCDDIDLCIWDENGNKIECDELEDDAPIVEITPRWTGEFSIRVSMYDCEVNPCYFGVGIFARK